MPKPVKKGRKAGPQRDVNLWARNLVERSTAEREPVLPAPNFKAQLSAYMSKLGTKGGQVSGKLRMQNLSEQDRREIASRAARARWEAVAKRKAGKKR